jgi:hypothetical protein
VNANVRHGKTIESESDLEFNPDMTALLEKAISRVSDLPSKRQNDIARFVLAEIDAEARWDASFLTSQDELSALAAAALTERRRGKTRKMDLVHDF